MKAKELRIGNYVEFYLIDTALPESEWKWVLNPVEISDFEDIEDETSYRPIPLTDKCIKDFGFVNYKETYSKFPLNIFLSANGFEYFHAQFGGKFVKLEFIHQLQNLYFALTGEELIIIN